MQYIKRDIEKTITEASVQYAALILTGPRQTGKTTTLKKLAADNRKYISLDDLEAMRMAQRDPEMFISLYPPPVLIDEVQYAPELFRRIKIEIDNGASPGSYWMTGSQTFRLMRLAQESLAGRVAVMSMSGLSQSEIYNGANGVPFKPDLDFLRKRAVESTVANTAEIYERIWRGSLPGHISGKFPNRNLFYSGYTQTYINRDIGDMIERVNSLQFEDFIRCAAVRTAQMLNIHDIARDIGISDDTAKRWLLLLEKSGVIFYLRPYSNNLIKRTVKTPKMYFFDTGLVSYLAKYPNSEILQNGALAGVILENYIVCEIVKSYTNSGLIPTIYYYRDKDGKEIDLILEANGLLYPIEIKKSASPAQDCVKTFSVLDAAATSRGCGAVICTKTELSAFDRNTLIIPSSLI